MNLSNSNKPEVQWQIRHVPDIGQAPKKVFLFVDRLDKNVSLVFVFNWDNKNKKWFVKSEVLKSNELVEVEKRLALYKLAPTPYELFIVLLEEWNLLSNDLEQASLQVQEFKEQFLDDLVHTVLQIPQVYKYILGLYLFSDSKLVFKKWLYYQITGKHISDNFTIYTNVLEKVSMQELPETLVIEIQEFTRMIFSCIFSGKVQEDMGCIYQIVIPHFIGESGKNRFTKQQIIDARDKVRTYVQNLVTNLMINQSADIHFTTEIDNVNQIPRFIRSLMFFYLAKIINRFK